MFKYTWNDNDPLVQELMDCNEDDNDCPINTFTFPNYFECCLNCEYSECSRKTQMRLEKKYSLPKEQVEYVVCNYHHCDDALWDGVCEHYRHRTLRKDNPFVIARE